MSSTKKQESLCEMEAAKEKAAKDLAEGTNDLGSLEEDDEFEEFPADEVGSVEKEPEIYWEENWDDDNIEADFSKQLLAVVAKKK